ncbi:MAG: dihydrolipoyllysine-residue acetyltransferase [Ignavibacteriales bacterium]|nr:dihydrolipoyllysine-residue acetyltransferase [Ignavibacteriales bacterium]MCB9207767.1 dihydrolipoyllysine-residue acetyltransferase [Ignavibacteriales bacterium]
MAFEFKLPELGENIEQADIVKVLVKVGDSVEVDQILLEIETDKATVEVPAEKSGTVKSVNAKDGDTVKVGSVIFTFDEENGTESIQETPKEEPKLEVVEPKAEVKKEENKQNEEQQSGGIIEFKLPELGENIESADVTKVLVKVGDKVEKDQVLLEIETDKATVEVPAEFSGVVKEVKIKEGEKAKVGSVVLVIESGKSTAKQETTIEKPAKTVESVKEEKITTPKPDVTKQLVTPNESVDVARKKSFATKIAPAAPTVRRFAREIGVDINEVSGSGPAGRISIDDVKKFAKSFNEKLRSGGAGMPIGIKREALPDFSKWGKINKEPMSNVRKKTAEHLSYAWATIPHVTQFDKADITDIENLRKQFAKKAEVAGGKLTVTAILLKVIAAALKVFPQFNASVDMDNKEIIFKNYFNIGVAVDTEKGLIVPVIKDVDKKNILQLSAELAEISTKARDKKITLEDLQGGCFSISNLGGIGGTAFTPIVNSPEVAILGVSRGSFEQVYKNGEFVPRMMLPLSLSYDHRIIDGADAARFIRWVVNALEQPFLLTLEG